MSKRTKKTQQAAKPLTPPQTITLTMPPKLALDLIQAGASWYGASFRQIAEALLKQVNAQTAIAPPKEGE